MTDDDVVYPDFKEFAKESRKVLEDISKEKLVQLINLLAEKLEKRDLLDDLQAYLIKRSLRRSFLLI